MKPIWIATIALVAASTAAAFEYDSYTPSTLKDVFALADQQCGEPNSRRVGLVASKETHRVKAVWSGDLRPIDPTALEILESAEKANTGKFAAPMATLFKREARVADDGVDYWLPIQEQIVKYFEDEAKGGKTTTLFVAYFGCSTKQGKTVAVTINEFDATGN